MINNYRIQDCVGPFSSGFSTVTNSIAYLETTLNSYCGNLHKCSEQNILSLLKQLASNCTIYTPDVIEAAEIIYKSNIVPSAWCLKDTTGNYCQLKALEVSPDITGNTNETDPSILCSNCYQKELQLAVTYLKNNRPSLYPIVGQNITRTVDDIYGKVYNSVLLQCGSTNVSGLSTPADLVFLLESTTGSVLELIPTASSSIGMSANSHTPVAGGARSIFAWNMGLCAFTIILVLFSYL